MLTITTVLIRAESIIEQILRVKLPPSQECTSMLQTILSQRVDLVPVNGLNILRVLVYAKRDETIKLAVDSLCQQLTATETFFPGTNYKLVYEVVR